MGGCSVVWLFGCLAQRWTDTNVAQAYKDAQVIPTFSGEETYQGHILDIYGTYLQCIENIFWTYLELIREIS